MHDPHESFGRPRSLRAARRARRRLDLRRLKQGRRLRVKHTADAPATFEPLESRLLLSAVVEASKIVQVIGDDGDGIADPGETLQYAVTISNTGTTDATGVDFTDTLDALTTLVPGSLQVTPLALDDAYDVVGNTLLQITDVNNGLLGNDLDPDDVGAVIGTDLSVTPGSVARVSGSVTGGNLTAAPDGTFSYVPPVGVQGNETFEYTITDADGLDSISVGFVVFTISDMVWYVDNTATAGGDGRSSAPFQSLAPLDGAGGPDSAGDVIFVFDGTGTTAGPIALENNQQLIGQGVDLVVGGQTLVSATNRPTIDNAGGGNAISLAGGNTVRGLDVSASGGGGIVGSSASTLLISDVSVATTNGVGVNITNATIADVTIDGLTVNNTNSAAGVDLSSNGGSFTFSGVDIDTAGGAGFKANSSGSVNVMGANNSVNTTTGVGVDIMGSTSGSSVTFQDIDVNGAISGIALFNTSGSTFSVTGNATITNSGGPGVLASNAGTVNISGGSVTTNVGVALDLNDLTAGITLTSVSATNSTFEGIDIDSVSGSLNVIGTTTINTTGAGRAGIDIASSSSGTFTFGIVDIDNSSGNGVSLSSNGGTIAFTDLDINNSTSNQRGLFATSNTGTLNITTGTINAGTATGVDIDNTNLGITLRSVSSVGGTAVGIDLNSTTGSFTVGTNAGTENFGDGGTIRHLGGTDPGVLLNDASNVTLRNMIIGDTAAAAGQAANNTSHVGGDGIRATNVTNLVLNRMKITNTEEAGVDGINVTNFTITDSEILNAGDEQEEHGLDFGEVGQPGLFGTALISNTVFDGFNESGLEVHNDSGTLNLTITGSTFANNQSTVGNAGEEAILLSPTGSAVMNVLVTGNSVFDTIDAQGIDATPVGSSTLNLTVENSSFDDIEAGDGAIKINPSGSGNANVTIRGNTFTEDFADDPFNVGDVIVLKNDTSGTLEATIQDNTITGAAGSGIDVVHDDSGNGTTILLIGGPNTSDGNNISGTTFEGIFINTREDPTTGGAPDVSVTIQNNTVGRPLDDAGFGDGFGSNAILVRARDATRLAANITGNTATGASAFGTQASGIRVQQENSSTFQIQGLTGGAAAFINGINTSTLAATDNGGTFTATTGTVTLPDPTPRPPVMAADGQGAGAAHLTDADLASIVQEAIARWSATGLTTHEQGLLAAATFDVVDMPDGQLGGTFVTSVQIDLDGAGHGYFVDSTPADDAEFATGSGPAGIDLLTVVMHELGHVLGRPHAEAPDVMADMLPSGTRRLPAVEDAQAASTNEGDASSTDATEDPVVFEDQSQTFPAAPAATTPAVPAAPIAINIGTLPAGKSVQITFDATVDTGTVPAGTELISNQGSVSYMDGTTPGTTLTDDPNVGGTTDPTSIALDAAPNLTIAKDDGSISVRPGDTIAYTLGFSNTGDQDASGVMISENLPMFTVFNAGASDNRWVDRGGGLIELPLGSLPGGGAGSAVAFAVDVMATVPMATTQIDNTATIADDATSGLDSDPSDNTASDSTPVIQNEYAIDDVTMLEGDGSGTTDLVFTVSRTDNSSAGSVDVQTADGIAKSTSDYTAIPLTTLNFAAGGAMSQQVMVQVNHDDVVELDETFFVNLSNPVGGAIGAGQGNGKITNDDSATISINDVTMNEGAGGGTTSFDFTVTIDAAVDTPFSFNVDTLDDTAEDPNGDGDYNLVSGVQPFTSTTPGQTGTISVVVNGDDKVELDETFFVNLSNIQALGRDVTFADNQGLGTVTNDDSATISIDDVTLAEDNSGNTTQFTFTVTLDTEVDTGVGVNFTAADDSATTADSDYTAAGSTLNFTGSAGETQTVTVDVTGDDKVELDETFFVNLSNIAANGRDVTFADSQGLGTVTNDDSTTISIDDVTMAEGAAPGTTLYNFTVTLDNAVDVSVGVNFDTADDSATTADSDYAVANGTFSFAGSAGETQPVQVIVTGDDKVELDETFFVDLSNIQALGRDVTFADNQGLGTITNDDAATIAIDDVTLAENLGGATTQFVFTVTLDSAVDVSLGLQFDSADDTALTADNDYAANTGGTLTFAGNAGETQTITVDVTGDSKVELDETFFVDLSNIAAGGRDVTFADNQGLGNITNDDAATITIDDVTLNEDNSGNTTQFIFTVTLDTEVDTGVSVNFATADDSATTADSDYTANNGPLTFAGNAGETQTVTVDVTGDDKVELDETFFVDLSNIAAGGRAVTFADNQGLGSILNDDSATLMIDDATAGEGGSGTTTPFGFTVTLDNQIDVPVNLNFATANATATTSDSDYSAAGGTLTFAGNAGEFVPITVNVTGDDKVELDETFFVDLSNIAAGGRAVTFADNRGLGSITNDDSATITIDDPTAAEGDSGATTPFVFTVTLDTEVDVPVNVNFASANDTATTIDGDFNAATGTLSFAGTPAGETQTLTVIVDGDDKVELDETFFVNLSGIAAGGRAVTFADNQGLGSITNDDSATISIDDVTLDEPDTGTTGLFSFIVTLDAEVDTPVLVDFTTLDGTATVANNDYNGQNGTLTFGGAAGETKTIAIDVIGDTAEEPDEEFFVELSNLQAGGRDVSLVDTTAMAVIEGTGTVVNEDIPPVADADGPYTVDEGGSVELNGSGTTDADQAPDTLLYEWDLDNDGQFDDATGIKPTFSAAGLDGPDTLNVSLRVTDNDGLTDVATSIVNVLNVDPVISSPNTSAASVGGAAQSETITLDATFTDTGTPDTHTATVDWGDGTPTTTATVSETAGSGTIADSHTYAAGGVYTVTMTLEDDDGGKDVQSTTVIVTGIGINNRVLQIVGTDRRDKVTVKEKDGQVTVKTNFADEQTFDPNDFDSIEALAFGGKDKVKIDKNLDKPVTLDGGEGNDKLEGGAAGDKLVGGPGNDKLKGNGGDDSMFGEDGDDKLNGSDGNDLLDGGAGNDKLKGGDGTDNLLGGGDDDKLDGGMDDDVLDGGAGNDVLLGGRGLDTMAGGDGNDRMFGNGEDDALSGGDGDDLVRGNRGHDILRGGNGNDLILGRKDGDMLLGEGDADILLGGSARDILIGGSTTQDNDALRTILDEWNAQRDFVSRVENILGTGTGNRLNGTSFLGGGAVFNDGVRDVLKGARGTDLLIAEDLDDIRGQNTVSDAADVDLDVDLLLMAP